MYKKSKQSIRSIRTSMIRCMLLLCSLWSTGWCSKIVSPWRSTTAIVKTNETFEVWFKADSGQNLNSVQLKSPYKTVTAVVTGTNTTTRVYDPLCNYSYNRTYTVKVPYGTPADRYDLVLKTSTGDKTSMGAVKVVNAYKSEYYVMHISDGHICQDTNAAVINKLLDRKSTMIDIANIMDVQIIVETGDNMYNVRNHPERTEAYFNGTETRKGMTRASAATFLVPGDHCAPNGNDWNQASVQSNSAFFNDYWGMQNSCFKYGKGRFMMFNNAWAVSSTSAKDHAYQITNALTWLNGAGSSGTFLVTAGHCYDKMHEYIDALKTLDLVLAGDKHSYRTGNPYEINGAGSPKIAYIAAAIRDYFEFNLFKVNDSAGTFTKPAGTTSSANVLYSGNKDTQSTWVPNLTLTYSKVNNGTFTNNTATITNKFGFDITGAHVRFVMKRGTYKVTGGTETQHFDGTLSGTDVTVVDASVNLPKGISTTTVNISLNGDPQPTLPTVGSIITLKAVNSKYVSATYSTNNTLIANKTTVAAYERFKVVNATNCIALQCMGNNKFVSIDSSTGSKPMVANRTKIGSYEKFKLVQSGTQIAIQSVLNTNYVSAISNGVCPLQASQTYVGGYEKFTWKIE